MRSTPLLIEATPIGGFGVRVAFEDGTAGEVDLSYLVGYGGVFEPLRDPDYFRRLRADPEAGTIVWPNEADIRPKRCTPTRWDKPPRRASPLRVVTSGWGRPRWCPVDGGVIDDRARLPGGARGAHGSNRLENVLGCDVDEAFRTLSGRGASSAVSRMLL